MKTLIIYDTTNKITLLKCNLNYFALAVSTVNDSIEIANNLYNIREIQDNNKGQITILVKPKKLQTTKN